MRVGMASGLTAAGEVHFWERGCSVLGGEIADPLLSPAKCFGKRKAAPR